MKQLALILLFLSSPTWAGYNATITSSAYTSCLAGRVSNGCYLTVGMAINSACNYAIVVKAIDAEAHTFQAFAQGNQNQVFSGTYASCTAVASGFTQPQMTNGAVDPAVIEGGISVGGGSVMDLITNPDDAKAIAVAFLLLLATAFAYRQVRKSIEQSDYSDEKH